MKDAPVKSNGEIEAVTSLYQQVLDAWNRRDAHAYAADFAEGSDVVGFDGSQMTGREEIASTLGQIFANHQTATYVAKVRSVRVLAPGVAVLNAVAGMVPPGQDDINPAVNAIQTLMAQRTQHATPCSPPMPASH